MSNIMVSVICKTYNQEKYIKDALEGFVKQETNFKFEVFVHDDASTDNTANIVREYEKKYPDLIKGIYQTENQYSKGNETTRSVILPRTTGKYIAFCEGDDYWTDPKKLQVQFDILERNPKIDMCAHAVERVDSKTKERLGLIAPFKRKKILTTEQVIFGEGGYLGTNSLFYRRTLVQDVPNFKKIFPYDYTTQILGSLRGGIYYIPDVMSAYRWQSEGSWTVRVCGNPEKHKKFCDEKNKMFEELDKETGYKYSEVIRARKNFEGFLALEREGKYKQLFQKENFIVYKRLPLERRIKILIKTLSPGLKKLRDRFRRSK